MKTTTKSLGFLAIANTSKLTAVKGYCNFLLPFTLMVVLFFINIFSVNAQGSTEPVAMKRQYTATSKGFDKLFNDELHKMLIVTYHLDVTTLDGKDLLPGTKVITVNKLTGERLTGPEVMRNAKHIFMYDNKLFYILDTVKIFSYDLTTSENKLLLIANDRIINFWNMSANRILVNARTGGASTSPYAIPTGVYRLAIYDYSNNTITNITDDPNIYQAFSVGNKVVYLESRFWFNAQTGPVFRANVYDMYTGLTYSRKDYNVLGSANATSDSTFAIRYEPAGGGPVVLSVVNVEKDLHDATFDVEPVLEGVGLYSPAIAGGSTDPRSSIIYFMNNEYVADGSFYDRNLRTGYVNTRPDGEVWSMNLSTFTEKYIGTFKDALTDRPIYGGVSIDGRFVSAGSIGLLTTKLYGETEAVRNVTIPGVKVYPNPATTGFTSIDVPANANIEIYSVEGRMTFSQKVSFGNTQIPISIGVNVVKVTIGNSVQTLKVIGL